MTAQYDRSEEPIVVSKPLIDIFFNPSSKQYANLKNPTDAISLYLFYYYTAKWQKTNQPKATTSYAAKGLKWTEERIRKTKKILISLDLIENIISRDEVTKSINGHYIFVKFIWSKEKAILHSTPPSGQTYSIAQTEGNALNNSNKNALNDNIKTIINDSNRFDESDLNNSSDCQENNLQKELPDKITSEVGLSSLKLIEYWSSFGQTSNHDTSYPYNKNCLQLVKLLSSLLKGTFARNKQFDINWLKEQNFPDSWFKQAWTFQELSDALLQASKYALEGYPPQSNKKYYKSLSDIIYNPRKQISLLFAARKNPPQPINIIPKLKLEKWVEVLKKKPIWPRGYKFDDFRLDRGLIELKTFADNLINDFYNKSRKYYGCLELVMNEYVAWLDTQDWLEIKESIIGTNNKVFHQFIEEQEKEIGVKIRSKGWK